MVCLEALAVLAAARVGQRRFAEALEASGRATAWMRDNGGVGYVEGILRLARTEALVGIGARAQAKAEVEAALRRLIARADTISDPELRAGFLRGLPEHARTLELAETLL